MQVLHYESHTLEEFARKWSNHLTSGHRLVARSERRRLASAMQADGWSEWPAELAEQVRRELFAATALDDREGLERLGLLVTPALPRCPPERTPSDPRLGLVREKLAALAGTDKSRFWLGAGVGGLTPGLTSFEHLFDDG